MLFQILESSTNCSGDISSCCSDFAIANIIWVIKILITMIQVIVPIILIVMATIQLAKMMASPDDKNGENGRSLLNKFISAIIIFFIPMLVNLVLNLVTYADLSPHDIVACWNSAEEMHDILESTSYTSSKTDNNELNKMLADASKYEDGKSDSGSSSSTATGSGRVDPNSYSQSDLELIYAITAQEDNGSYDGALAVITCAMNRADQNYGNYGDGALAQFTAPSQFCYSPDIGGDWESRLNGNVPDYVKQAVNDCLTGGVRNHNYTSFRSTAGSGGRTQIGGNWYF